MVKIKIEATDAQIRKLMQGKTVQLKHSQLGSGKTIDLHPENAKRVLKSMKNNTGIRLSLSPHEITGEGIFGKKVDKFLEKKGLYIHVYGSNKFLWNQYNGSLPYHKKDEALLPYKYTFNVENNSIKNYCTEKLIDGILSETLVFYSGCYNIREYIDKRAFVCKPEKERDTGEAVAVAGRLKVKVVPAIA